MKKREKQVPPSLRVRLPYTPRPCAFCEDTAVLSGEHIWSGWMGDILGPNRPGKYVVTDQFGGPDAEMHTGTVGAMDMKIPVVCSACNNGWMSRLETEHAKPVLDPPLRYRGVCFRRPEIESLAIFAFKTAVIADHASARAGGPFFQPISRRRFKDSLIVPPAVHIWHAALVTPRERKGVFRSHYAQATDSRYKNCEIFVMTWGITPILVQVLAVRWMGGTPQVEPLPNRFTDNVFDEVESKFWPEPPEHLTIPSKAFLDEDTIGKFCYRWTSGIVTLPDRVPPRI